MYRLCQGSSTIGFGVDWSPLGNEEVSNCLLRKVSGYGTGFLLGFRIDSGETHDNA